jgi:hypothetical protein
MKLSFRVIRNFRISYKVKRFTLPADQLNLILRPFEYNLVNSKGLFNLKSLHLTEVAHAARIGVSGR